MNEVDVCYMTERGQFKSRKTALYNTFNEAVSVFVRTVKKFHETNQHGLITLRTRQGNLWTLEKAERT